MNFLRLFSTLFLAWFCCLSPSVGIAAESASSIEETYQEARKALENGNVEGAEKLSRMLLKEKHFSVGLFQLLGHISYRQNKLGEAALWYHRASLFPPPQAELRQNLAHIRDRTGNVSYANSDIHQQYAKLLSRTQWFHLFAISLWTFILVWVLGTFISKRSGSYTFLMFIRVVACIVALFAIAGWYWHPSYQTLKDYVVVTAPETKAYTAATTTSGSVMNIPTGSELRRLEERGAWTYVEIPTKDLNRGWVPSDALTQLWPFDPGYLE